MKLTYLIEIEELLLCTTSWILFAYIALLMHSILSILNLNLGSANTPTETYLLVVDLNIVLWARVNPTTSTISMSSASRPSTNSPNSTASCTTRNVHNHSAIKPVTIAISCANQERKYC